MTSLPRADGRKLHQDALERAWETVALIDVEDLARDLNAVGANDPDGTAGIVRLSMLGAPLVIDIDGRTIRYDQPEGPVLNNYLQVLVLHYLAGVGSTQLTNRLISFRELEGGAMYYTAFKARALTPLVKEFGYKPELLRHVAESMGGERLALGSVGYRFAFFDKLPVSIVLWLGDVEVSASANILFDASASRMMSTEDMTVVGGVTSRALIKRARN